jgi:Tfp pilus assembly protein PilO
MIKNISWRAWKKIISYALVALFVVDLGLVYIFWQTSREGVEAMRDQRNHLEKEAKLLKGDVARGQEIRGSLPAVGKECDAFYTNFLQTSNGYSEIVADLGSIASKAGLRTSGVNYTQKEVKSRGVTQIVIVDSVEGDYPAIIQFINGLERSKYFYLLNDLRLDSASTGGIRLHLELRTYFRT